VALRLLVVKVAAVVVAAVREPLESLVSLQREELVVGLVLVRDTVRRVAGMLVSLAFRQDLAAQAAAAAAVVMTVVLQGGVRCGAPQAVAAEAEGLPLLMEESAVLGAS